MSILGSPSISCGKHGWLGLQLWIEDEIARLRRCRYL